MWAYNFRVILFREVTLKSFFMTMSIISEIRQPSQSPIIKTGEGTLSCGPFNSIMLWSGDCKTSLNHHPSTSMFDSWEVFVFSFCSWFFFFFSTMLILTMEWTWGDDRPWEDWKVRNCHLWVIFLTACRMMNCCGFRNDFITIPRLTYCWYFSSLAEHTPGTPQLEHSSSCRG